MLGRGTVIRPRSWFELMLCCLVVVLVELIFVLHRSNVANRLVVAGRGRFLVFVG